MRGPGSAAEDTRLGHWEGEPVPVLERVWGLPELEVHDRLPSTNDRLRARLPSVPDFSTVIAEEQTTGRGRNGTGWRSPRGGLWMSFVVRPRSASARGLVPLRVGLVVAHAVRRTAGVELRIKWPNDLWADGRKLGGILVEGIGDAAVVGIGINVHSAPDPSECRVPPVALDELAARPASRTALAGAILQGARESLGRGGPVLRDEERTALAEHDLLAGRRIRVRPGPEGVARGIDVAGRLRVETDTGVVGVASGTIELL